MHLLVVAQAVAALVAVSSAKPITNHVSHEKRTPGYTQYSKRSRVDSDAVLPIRIGLKQTGLENGYEHLMDVSHPHSPNYGRHWTSEEVIKAFAPSDETVAAVYDWLVEAGIARHRIAHSDNKGWLAFDATTEEAESLFLAEFYEHVHDSSDTMRIGCDEYHLPKHIQPHVDYVTPGVKLSAPVKKRVDKDKRWWKPPQGVWPPAGPWHMQHPPTLPFPPPWNPQLPADLQDCGRNITPTCIKALYDIPPAPTPAVPGNTFGIFEDGDFYAQADLNLFFAQYAPNVPQGTHPTLDAIDGAVAPVPQGSPYETGESDIDFDLAFSLTYPQPITLYQVDDLHYSTNSSLPGFLNTFLDAIDGSYCTYCADGECGDAPGIDPTYPDPNGSYKGQLMCGVYKPTAVISVSYGESEYDLPAYYEERQCNEFMKLGLQGTSIFISSGDYGVAAFPFEDNPNGCLGPAAAEGLGIFNPDWPSSCPYVTAVGATQLYADQTVLNQESVMHVNLSGTAQNFSSGGGFANNFARPSYQAFAVEEYLNNFVPDYPFYEGAPDFNTTKGLYNRAGRAYPDVSANGAYLRAYLDGLDYHWFGTSLASPIWGSITTLINGERLLQGKGTVGFVNPVLYEHPWVLHDIVNGTNVGCGTEGFHAAPGWDPSSGLGTPDYPQLLELFLSLP